MAIPNNIITEEVTTMLNNNQNDTQITLDIFLSNVTDYINSVQHGLAFTANQIVFLTFHKRGDISQDKEFLVSALKMGKSAIVIPLPWDFMPAEISRYLIEQGIPPKTKVNVFEHLTWPEEKFYSRTLDNCIEKFSDVWIMVIDSIIAK